MLPESKFRVLVDVLGMEIVTGELAPGAVVNLASLEERFEVSRTVAREAMRSLEAKGMIAARRRVGLIVAEPTRWNVLDPQVICWRLSSPAREEQLRSLTDLRIAVEPTAACLSATLATAAQRTQLVSLARSMRELAAGPVCPLLDADTQFHSTILRASGNEMLITLEPALTAVLTDRAREAGRPYHTDESVLDLHERTALAIAAGDGAAAEAHCRALVTGARVTAEPA